MFEFNNKSDHHTNTFEHSSGSHQHGDTLQRTTSSICSRCAREVGTNESGDNTTNNNNNNIVGSNNNANDSSGVTSQHLACNFNTINGGKLPTGGGLASGGRVGGAKPGVNGRPVRKVPAFSIKLPERDTLSPNAGEQGSQPHNNRDSSHSSSSPSKRAGLVSSQSPTTHSGFCQSPIPNTPSGYHERVFGSSPFGATRLLPHLYLGNEGDASMPHELLHRNIRAIANVAFDCKPQDYSAFNIDVLHLALRDCGDEDIHSHFPRICAWIHGHIKKGHGVLIHCRLGVSRSATIAIAYLMTYGISQPTRVMTVQHRYRVTPISEQKPQGHCRTCSRHGRSWHHYEDNAERINRGEFHTHPEESRAAAASLAQQTAALRPSSPLSLVASTASDFNFTDYNDVFTYVAMRREQISPNLGFAMQLRKLNVSHGFSDFFAEMSPGPSDDYCFSSMSRMDSGGGIDGGETYCCDDISIRCTWRDGDDESEREDKSPANVLGAMREAITAVYSSAPNSPPSATTREVRREDEDHRSDSEGLNDAALCSLRFTGNTSYKKEISPALV